MVDSGSGEQSHSGKISRRQFLKTAGVAAATMLSGGLLAACGGNNPQEQAPQPRQPEVPAPIPTETRPSSQTLQYIQAGRNLVTAEDRNMFEQTTPGLDMPFFYNERVRAILRMSDTRQKVLAAVGFLDVENNPLYRQDRPYACNLYSLTLTRMLLGDDAIGSRYLNADGTPWVISRDDGQVNWSNPNSIAKFDAAHTALSGDNLDWWMRKYGSKFGWNSASEAEADAAMKTGEYIALVATTQEFKQKEQQRLLAEGKGEVFYGHVATLVPGGRPGEYGVSQATNNYTFRPLDKPHDHIFNPEYHTYLMKVPQKSWIDARLNK